MCTAAIHVKLEKEGGGGGGLQGPEVGTFISLLFGGKSSINHSIQRIHCIQGIRWTASMKSVISTYYSTSLYLEVSICVLQLSMLSSKRKRAGGGGGSSGP